MSKKYRDTQYMRRHGLEWPAAIMRPITIRNFYTATECNQIYRRAKFIRERLELTLPDKCRNVFHRRIWRAGYPIDRRIMGWGMAGCVTGMGEMSDPVEGEGEHGGRSERERRREGQKEDDNQLADNRLFISRDFIGVIALTAVATSSNFERTRALPLSRTLSRFAYFIPFYKYFTSIWNTIEVKTWHRDNVSPRLISYSFNIYGGTQEFIIIINFHAKSKIPYNYVRVF